MPAHHLRSCLLLLPAGIASTMILFGCNPSEETSAPAGNGQTQTNTAPGTSAPGGGTPNAGIVTTGPGGQTLIGGIPVEVWFPDPLAVVGQSGNISPSPVSPVAQQGPDTPAETPNQDPTPDPVKPEQTASVDWGKLIPMEILDGEIKSIRNFFTPTLQTVGSYNRDYLQIPEYGMTMAALAQIALRHPGDTLWKDKAAALRDLSYNLANAADGPGRQSFEAATLQFEHILQIFNGSKPELSEEPDPAAVFSDKADRGPLMKRIDRAHRWLTSNTPAASALTDSKERALHETVVLATLVQVSGDESYLYTDEPDYKKHVSEVIAATEKTRDAIEKNNFDEFKEGLSVISRKCGECHSQYKD